MPFVNLVVALCKVGKSKLSQDSLVPIPLLKINAQQVISTECLLFCSVVQQDHTVQQEKMDDNNDVDVIKLFGVDDKFNCITIGLEAAKHIRLVADCFSLDDDVTDDEETDDKDDDEKTMTVDKVKYKALEKVVKFCTRCVEHPHELEQLNEFKLPISSYHLREIIPEWHADFVSKMSVAELFELFAASNYLMIDPLEKLLSVPVSILITVYDSTGKKLLR